jgi:hypothetical protein
MTQLDEAKQLVRNILDGIGAILPDAVTLRAIVDLAQNTESQIDDSISMETWYRLRDLVTAVETLERAWTPPQVTAKPVDVVATYTATFNAAYPLTVEWDKEEKRRKK